MKTEIPHAYKERAAEVALAVGATIVTALLGVYMAQQLQESRVLLETADKLCEGKERSTPACEELQEPVSAERLSAAATVIAEGAVSPSTE